MSIERVVNDRVLSAASRWLAVLSGVAIIVAVFIVFAVVPSEQVMGAVQRVFYFHVGSAIGSYLVIAVLAVSSICYLLSQKEEWDLVARSAAEVALLFCSIVLFSGMIWGHSAWNTWWRWEPRLVSFLVLWLILFSYNSFRVFSAGLPGQARLAAILGVVAAINIPLVIFSVRFLSQAEQLHPQVIANQGLRDPWYVYGLLVATLSLIVTAVWLCVSRIGLLLLECDIRRLRRKVGRDG